MGLGPGAVKLYLELWQRGLFENIDSVVDVGSQELHLEQSEFERLLREAGIPGIDPSDFPDIEKWPAQPRCSAKPFYNLLGVNQYSCIDMNAELGAIPLDLNEPLEDKSLYGKFDLVTDHGCNEHAFNVAEAYRTMHRLCRNQGLMICCQGVWNTNGYYLFDLSFFEGLAAANNYKILFSSYIVDLESTESESNHQFHVPLSRHLLDAFDNSKLATLGICYVLQKQNDEEFQLPYQGPYLSQRQGHSGFELQFLPNPPSRTYVPMSEEVQSVRTRDLVRLVIKRILGKF